MKSVCGSGLPLFGRWCLLLGFWFTFAAAGAGAQQIPPEDMAAYKQALEDTRETTQCEICPELLAVMPGPDITNYRLLSSDGIKWEDPDSPGTSRLLVVAFMSEEVFTRYYEPYMEKESFSLQKSLWVTVVPELKNFFIGKSCPPTQKRVMQLLGLHPVHNADNDVLLEMWVEPKDLFRPCPDPEITDHEAELAIRVPHSDHWIYPSDLNPFLLMDPYALFRENAFSPAETFKEWFRFSAATMYNTEGDISDWGWPWTRLGYTYDWGDPDHHVGLSEFIVRIDPNWGFVNVKLERAINGTQNPELWDAYFRCGPQSPLLTVAVNEGVASLFWTPVPDADGFLVKYKVTERGRPFAPPFLENQEIDVGAATQFTATLRPGDCFYVAVQPYSEKGRGGLSNIEYVYVP